VAVSHSGQYRRLTKYWKNEFKTKHHEHNKTTTRSSVDYLMAKLQANNKEAFY
jgi:hypothetical protein